MAKPDLEDVIEACKTLFETGFPTVLAGVEASKTISTGVRAPVQYYFGDTQNIPNYPSLVFSGYNMLTEEEEYGWRRQTYQLEIEAHLSDMNLQNLSRMTRRYGAAIDEMLRNNQTLGGVSREILNIKQKYFDSLKGARLIQAMVVTFDVVVFTD